jgi:hypothetical protein
LSDPATSPTTTATDLFNLIELIRPWQMASDTKVRIGRHSDGGYVMPGITRKSNLILSIGIGNQTSFDDDLIEQGALVYQFDHTIEDTPSRHRNATFFRKGWGVNDEGNFLSLRSMMALMEWEGARHPVLKFDTEGAEWSCLAHAAPEDLNRFDVLVGEFHGLDLIRNRQSFDTAMQIFTKLATSHRCIHIHGNNTAGFTNIAGVPFPRVMELTYVKTDVTAFFGFSNEPIPGPLDAPNDFKKPDMYLRAF